MSMLLYHAGYQVIQRPDVRHGRKNADLGQGFYLTADRDFACRWTGLRKDERAVLNTYSLSTEGLRVHRFDRGEAWFDYIFANRRLRPDTLNADIVIGPIANDTIYDTFGIITSGFLDRRDSLRLLMIGPEYTQVALKTERAAEQLTWLDAAEIAPDDAEGFQRAVAQEQHAYQQLFAAEMERISGREDG